MEYRQNSGTSVVSNEERAIQRAQEWLAQAEASIAQGQYQAGAGQLMQADLAMLPLSEAERNAHLLTARAFWLQGLIYFSRHLMEEARQELLLAGQRLQGHSDREAQQLLAEVLGRLGNISHLQSESGEAIAFYRQSSEVASAVGAYHIAVKAYNNIGNIHIGLGEMKAAVAEYRNGLVAAERSGDATARARAYRILAVFHANYGPFTEALDYAGRAMVACQQVSSQETRAIISSEVATVYLRVGESEQAASYLEQAFEQVRQANSKMGAAMVAIAVAELWHSAPTASAWPPSTEAAVIKALEDATEQPLLRSEALRRLSQLYVQRDDSGRARHCLSQVQNLSLSPRLSRDDKAIVAHTLAILLAYLGDEAAKQQFALAITIMEQSDLSRYQLACVWQDYARYHYQHDEVDAAEQAAKQADKLLQELGEQRLQLRVKDLGRVYTSSLYNLYPHGSFYPQALCYNPHADYSRSIKLRDMWMNDLLTLPDDAKLKTQSAKFAPQDFAVLLACLIFFGLTVFQLDLPGLYADEALDVVPAMQLLNGQMIDFGAVRGAYFPAVGLKLPVMNSDYQGVVGTYGVLPFLALGGVNVYSIRLFTIVTGLVALVLAYLWGRRLLGANVAAIAVLLLAVNPSWVFWSRIGIYVVAQIVPITLGVLYCLHRWWQGGRDGWLWGGAFLLGLGFSTKFLFLWLPLALLICYGLFSAPRIRNFGWFVGLRGQGTAGAASSFWRNTLISLGCFILGAFPFVWYNLTTRGTYYVVRDNLFHTNQGVNNSDLLGNLRRVVGDWVVMLDGSFFWFQAYGGQPYHNSIYPLAYLAALTLLLGGVVLKGRDGRWFGLEASLLVASLGLFLIWWYVSANVLLELAFFVCFGLLLGRLAVVARRTWYHRPIVFLTLMSALIVAMSAVTVSELLATHLLLLLPIPQLTLATAVLVMGSAVADYATRGRLRRAGLFGGAVAGALALILLVTDLGVDVAYHRDLTKQGGYTSFSDAIYQLNDYLLAQGATKPLLMDWGFQYNLQVLSNGKLNPQAIFQYTDVPDAAFTNALNVTLTDPSNLYIFHRPEATRYKGRYDVFMAEARRRGLTPTLVRTFYHRDGLPVYEIWQAVDKLGVLSYFIHCSSVQANGERISKGGQWPASTYFNSTHNERRA